MNQFREDHSNRLESLAGDYALSLQLNLDPHLQSIDARLAEAARQSPIPAGLSQRMFDASAGYLPKRKLQLAGESGDDNSSLVKQIAWHRLAWGRMAMAASVAIACIVAVWFLQRPHAPASPNLVASNHSNSTSTANAGSSELEIDLLAFDVSSDVEYTVGYLLDAHDLTSSEDVLNIRMLARSDM